MYQAAKNRKQYVHPKNFVKTCKVTNNYKQDYMSLINIAISGLWHHVLSKLMVLTVP